MRPQTNPLQQRIFQNQIKNHKTKKEKRLTWSRRFSFLFYSPVLTGVLLPHAKFASPVAGCDFTAKSLAAHGVQFYGEEEMKMQQTLRQMCAELKVSRRVIQGYEKAGLMASSGKNKYGYLLYGKAEQERARLIRFYQQLGFPLKEIKKLLNAPDSVKKSAIQVRIEELEVKHTSLLELIQEAKEYIATL